MEKQLRLKYRWIKQRRKEVFQFLSEEYGIDSNTISKADIESDLGITGDDAAELIEKFENRFYCDIRNLDFSEYFYSEADVMGFNNFIPLNILLKLILLPVAIVLLPFSVTKFKEIIFYNPLQTEDTKKKKLTVGDLITCSFTKKFTLRSEVLIKLV
jgi:hypothetical protein